MIKPPVWERWIIAEFYTQEIKTFLSKQKDIFASKVAGKCYKSIVEVGCGEGSFLAETAMQWNLNYVGIDNEIDAIERFQKRLVSNKLFLDKNVKLIYGDIHELSKDFKRSEIASKDCLVVFPFNVFGLLHNPKLVLSQIANSGQDILIFGYRTQEVAQIIRRNYYGGLDFDKIKRVEDEKGILFISDDGLFSYAYYPQIMWNWLHVTNYANITSDEFSTLGIYYFAENCNSLC